MSKQFWIDHFSSPDPEILERFIHLKPDVIIDVQEELGILGQSGESFESAENRVFGFDEIIVKFYRPGRWSKEAIQEEVEFLNDLHDADLSVVKPASDVKTWQGLHYLAYHKIQMPFSETGETLTEMEVKKLSHLLAKIHQVGKKREAKARAQFNARAMCEGCFDVIQESGYLPKELTPKYQELLARIIEKLDSFKDIPLQRIHGDSYSGNVLWKSGDPILIDFDDFQMAPIAMDLKLLSFPWRLDTLSKDMDRRERRAIQQELVLKSYREINDFPKEWENVFPLMSAYRDIQFDAWFSSRWRDPGFAAEYSDDDITDPNWWKENIEGLEQLLEST